MTTVWKTKYGPRKVRHDPPTLEEAIFAARGFTDDVEEQVSFAAGLIDMPEEEVRAALKKTAPLTRKPMPTLAFTSRGGTERSVVVEKKATRRVVIPARPSGRSFV